MADNTTLNTGTGGDSVRDIDKGGIKTQVVALDIGGTGAESLYDGKPLAGASSVPPSTTEGASAALSTDLARNLRTRDASFNYEMLSETNDLLRILIREMWSLRMGFVRELRDMPDPSELDFHNPDNLLN